MPEPQPTKYPPLHAPVDELALTEIKSAILAKLTLAIGKDTGIATRHDWYKAAALVALMQNINSAAAAISIISLMARSSEVDPLTIPADSLT